LAVLINDIDVGYLLTDKHGSLNVYKNEIGLAKVL